MFHSWASENSVWFVIIFYMKVECFWGLHAFASTQLCENYANTALSAHTRTKYEHFHSHCHAHADLAMHLTKAGREPFIIVGLLQCKTHVHAACPKTPNRNTSLGPTDCSITHLWPLGKDLCRILCSRNPSSDTLQLSKGIINVLFHTEKKFTLSCNSIFTCRCPLCPPLGSMKWTCVAWPVPVQARK